MRTLRNALSPPLWLALAACLLALPLQAARAAADPESLVHDTTERMLAKLKSERSQIKEHPERIYGLVDDIVLPHFDFERMSRWVLGKNWRKAEPPQQQRFIEEFRNLLVRTYATALTEYNDQTVHYLPSRIQPSDTEVTVKTEILPPGGTAIPVDYSLYKRDDGAWKVFDVAVDGLSLVGNYRSNFANEVRTGGIDGLIAKLVERNQRGSK